MIVSADTDSLDRWRQKLGGRRRYHRPPRQVAALGHLVNGPVTHGLVEIEKLTMVLLYDELTENGRLALRLVGYAASRVTCGVRFGGAVNCKFFKDLSLQPVSNARGYRIDLASAELLALGPQLDRHLDRHVRYRQRLVREHVQLPKLWAGFRAADASEITADGPELEAYCRRTGKPAQELLTRIRREHFGLSLLPLSWTSNHLQQAVAVFADLERFPRRQVFRLQHLPDDLLGFQDACEFDFFTSKFRTNAKWRGRGENQLASVTV